MMCYRLIMKYTTGFRSSKGDRTCKNHIWHIMMEGVLPPLFHLLLRYFITEVKMGFPSPSSDLWPRVQSAAVYAVMTRSG